MRPPCPTAACSSRGVAEAGEDTYHDGQCVGAGIGVLDADGDVAAWVPLDPAFKVEGIEAHRRR